MELINDVCVVDKCYKKESEHYFASCLKTELFQNRKFKTHIKGITKTQMLLSNCVYDNIHLGPHKLNSNKTAKFLSMSRSKGHYTLYSYVSNTENSFCYWLCVTLHQASSKNLKDSLKCSINLPQLPLQYKADIHSHMAICSSPGHPLLQLDFPMAAAPCLLASVQGPHLLMTSPFPPA